MERIRRAHLLLALLGAAGSLAMVLSPAPPGARVLADGLANEEVTEQPVLASGGAVPAEAPRAPEGWQTYRDEQAGFVLAYPPDWRADTQPGRDGPVTTFTPSEEGAEIALAVAAREQIGLADVDRSTASGVPDARCRRLTVDDLPAVQCLDAPPSGRSTVVLGPGRRFVITGRGAGADDDVYQRLVDSFRLRGGGAPPPPRGAGLPVRPMDLDGNAPEPQPPRAPRPGGFPPDKPLPQLHRPGRD